VYLTRRLSVTQLKSTPLRGGLQDIVCVAFSTFIDENLSEDCASRPSHRLRALARHHFAELFRKSVGDSPHRYVMGQRVERAKRMLRLADTSIAEIALAGRIRGSEPLFEGLSPACWRQSPHLAWSGPNLTSSATLAAVNCFVAIRH